MKQGKIFIIAGSSGVGKDTIIHEIMARFPELKKPVSYTDRERRLDDNPNSYHFISKEVFSELVETGEIFEWEYARDDRRYGSSKKEVVGNIENNLNQIKVVGPKMVANFKDVIGSDKVKAFFVKYENLELLKKRIAENRKDATPADIEIRFNQAKNDLEYEKDCNYSIINPEGHIEIAIEQISRIIKEELSDK